MSEKPARQPMTDGEREILGVFAYRPSCRAPHERGYAKNPKMTVVGERLVYELNGQSCLPLEPVASPRKGLTVSRSFGRSLTQLEPLKEALLQFVGRAAEKLRSQRLMTSHLIVFVMTNRFSTTRPFYGQSATVRLCYPTDYTPDLIRAAVQLLDRIYRPGFHY